MSSGTQLRRLLAPAALALSLSACHPFENIEEHPFNDTLSTDTSPTEDIPEGDGSSVDGSSGTLDASSADAVPPEDVDDPDDGVIIPDTCGDGVVDEGESCDEGAALNGSTQSLCRADCTLPRCGDGVVDTLTGERCDDGNTTPDDACDANCLWNAPDTCGDGTVQDGEACDDGDANSDVRPDACRTHCQSPTCGDAVIDLTSGEHCDDGNTENGDGCDDTCHVEATESCGNDILETSRGELCDDGNLQNGDGCDDTCRFELVGETCGDGTKNAPLERCDDANTANGDGCNPTCNLLGEVKTLLDQPLNFGGGIAVDNQNLWLGVGTVIYRVDLSTGCLLDRTRCAFEAVAGSEGPPGYSDNDVGTAAVLGNVSAMTSDGRRIYFNDGNNVIRAMSTRTPYAVTTIAGKAGVCGNEEGTGASASFRDIRALTWDAPSRRVYLLDSCYANLRALDPDTGTVVNVTGKTATASPLACDVNCTLPTGIIEGTPDVAQMVSPRYMTSAQNGMLYITDTNGQALLSYNIYTRHLRKLTGGVVGYVDGPARQAKLDRPRGLTSDGTSLYWSEQNAKTIRQFTLTTEIASTLSGERDCPGPNDGLGGTGLFTNVCGAEPANGWARFTTPNALLYHPSGRLLVRDETGLRVIR